MRPWVALRRRLRPPVLALGGGGARGFAHLGVLEVVERERIRVRGIAGTSAGAVMGAMLAVYGEVAAVRARWEEAFRRKLVREVPTVDAGAGEERADSPWLQAARRIKDRIVISFAVNRTTVLDEDDLERVLDFLLPDVRIEELPLPFVAVATDLSTGEEVRLASGPLRPAVQASASIPGMVPPVELGGRPLVDGGVVAEVPVAAARELGRPVVAVDVSMDLPPYRQDALVIHTMFRTSLITSRQLRREQLKAADLVIRPAVGDATWSAWELRDRFLAAGRDAAERAVAEGRL